MDTEPVSPTPSRHPSRTYITLISAPAALVCAVDSDNDQAMHQRASKYPSTSPQRHHHPLPSFSFSQSPPWHLHQHQTFQPQIPYVSTLPILRLAHSIHSQHHPHAPPLPSIQMQKFKLVFLGEQSVGKTALIGRFVSIICGLFLCAVHMHASCQWLM
jgi:hypothetical protein